MLNVNIERGSQSSCNAKTMPSNMSEVSMNLTNDNNTMQPFHKIRDHIYSEKLRGFTFLCTQEIGSSSNMHVPHKSETLTVTFDNSNNTTKDSTIHKRDVSAINIYIKNIT